jgi:glycosyltransferase involved in cell wall biosynthesis
MKVCWFGIYHREYSRNSVLIDGLKSSGIEVITCNVEQSKGFTKYFKLVKKLIDLDNDYDVLFCAFPVNYYAILAKLITKKPIVVDAFFPFFDAYVKDRKIFNLTHLRYYVYYMLDKMNLYLADSVVTDTEQHKAYWLSIDPEADVNVISVGAHSKEFYPTNYKVDTNKFIVTFHGSYIPLQGIDKIVEAANILKENKKIVFRLIGTGQTFTQIMKKISEYELEIEILPWLSILDLNNKLNEADVILGIFGDSAKTERVIPNKVFQGIAIKKPVITKDTLAAREVFNDEELFMVKNSPQDIANAILKIMNEPELGKSLSEKAYKKFKEKLNENVLGEQLKSILVARFSDKV